MSVNYLRLATLVGLLSACLVTALAPASWAMPGQDVSPQTIPTRTPDRRTRQPTVAPLPTSAAITATPNSPRVTVEPASDAPAPLPTEGTTGEYTASPLQPPPDQPPPTPAEADTPPPTASPADTSSLLPSPSATPFAFPAVVGTPAEASREPPPPSSLGNAASPDVQLERFRPGMWGLMGGTALVLVGLRLLVSRPRGH